MSYYAKVENGIVTDVISAEQEFIDTLDGLWLKTSYNTRGGVHYGQDGQPDGGIALRMNFAGIGYGYDSVKDAFIPIQPYSDWILDEQTCLWIPPIPEPTGGGYYWDQTSHSWLEIK
jgi:hypothetical protein